MRRTWLLRMKWRFKHLRYDVMRLLGHYPARGGGLTKRELERRLLTLEARHPGFVADLLRADK